MAITNPAFLLSKRCFIRIKGWGTQYITQLHAQYKQLFRLRLHMFASSNIYELLIRINQKRHIWDSNVLHVILEESISNEYSSHLKHIFAKDQFKEPTGRRILEMKENQVSFIDLDNQHFFFFILHSKDKLYINKLLDLQSSDLKIKLLHNVCLNVLQIMKILENSQNYIFIYHHAVSENFSTYKKSKPNLHWLINLMFLHIHYWEEETHL